MHVRRLLGAAGLVLALGGCGIRATEVPTDFGGAPSRVPCSMTQPDVPAQSAREVPVQVFLLCGSSLVTVDREVLVPEGTADAQRRVIVAQGLLDQLAETPTAAEKAAGYTTYVRGGMSVVGPRPGDPEDTLRLSTPPAQLTSYALGQIVCTLSDSAAAEGDGSVILGGPGREPLLRYECTDAVRNAPSGNRPPSSGVTSG